MQKRLAGENALNPRVQEAERVVQHVPERMEEMEEQAAAQDGFAKCAVKRVMQSLDDVVRPKNIGQGISNAHRRR